MELPIKIAVFSCSLFVFIIIFGWVAFPALFKFGIQSRMTLQPGNELREMWSNLPFSVDFKVYIFNVTNSKNVENGETPMLDEIGPYVFDEWKTKINLVDNDTDDTVEFNAKRRWYFNHEKSGKLSGDEFVTIPHPLIMSMLLRTAQEKPPMLQMVYKAVNGIFDDPTSMFITTRVKDILFDGIYINCNRSDFIPHAACFELKQENSMVKLPNDGLLFSFFGYKNSSLDLKMKVKRGIQNPMDLNKVMEYKNSTKMRVWTAKECNIIKGTESSVYHSFLGRNETLYGFVPLLCREIPIIHLRNEEFHEFNTALYTTSFGDQSSNENEKCYCPARNYCMKKGAIDLSRCSGAPIVATFPHFYDADESYLESVRGLRPSENLHQTRINFEPLTGVILQAVNRLQFSFQLKRLPNISFMENVSEAMLPILWIEEAVALNSTYRKNLDKQVFLILKINEAIKWIFLLASSAGIVSSIYLFMQKKRGFSLENTIPKLGSDDMKNPSKSSNIISTLSNMVNDTNK